MDKQGERSVTTCTDDARTCILIAGRCDLIVDRYFSVSRTFALLVAYGKEAFSAVVSPTLTLVHYTNGYRPFTLISSRRSQDPSALRESRKHVQREEIKQDAILSD